MENTIEVEFYDHCEGEEGGGCGLGYAEFKCPSCGSVTHEYGDLWFNHDSPKANDDTCEAFCDRCKEEFYMEKTEKYNVYKYKIKK